MNPFRLTEDGYYRIVTSYPKSSKNVEGILVFDDSTHSSPDTATGSLPRSADNKSGDSYHGANAKTNIPSVEVETSDENISQAEQRDKDEQNVFETDTFTNSETRQTSPAKNEDATVNETESTEPTNQGEIVYPDGALTFNPDGRHMSTQYKKSLSANEANLFEKNMSRTIEIDEREITRLEAVEEIAKGNLDESAMKLSNGERNYLKWLQENLTEPLKIIRQAELQNERAIQHGIKPEYKTTNTSTVAFTNLIQMEAVKAGNGAYDWIPNLTMLNALEKISDIFGGTVTENKSGKHIFKFTNSKDLHAFLNTATLFLNNGHLRYFKPKESSKPIFSGLIPVGDGITIYRRDDNSASVTINKGSAATDEIARAHNGEVQSRKNNYSSSNEKTYVFDSYKNARAFVEEVTTKINEATEKTNDVLRQINKEASQIRKSPWGKQWDSYERIIDTNKLAELFDSQDAAYNSIREHCDFSVKVGKDDEVNGSITIYWRENKFSREIKSEYTKGKPYSAQTFVTFPDEINNQFVEALGKGFYDAVNEQIATKTGIGDTREYHYFESYEAAQKFAADVKSAVEEFVAQHEDKLIKAKETAEKERRARESEQPAIDQLKKRTIDEMKKILQAEKYPEVTAAFDFYLDKKFYSLKDAEEWRKDILERARQLGKDDTGLTKVRAQGLFYQWQNKNKGADGYVKHRLSDRFNKALLFIENVINNDVVTGKEALDILKKILAGKSVPDWSIERMVEARKKAENSAKNIDKSSAETPKFSNDQDKRADRSSQKDGSATEIEGTQATENKIENQRRREDTDGFFDEQNQEAEKSELADVIADNMTVEYAPSGRKRSTNEIFTPANVVQYMLDELEKNDPTTLSDPTKTFIDPAGDEGAMTIKVLSEKLKRHATLDGKTPEKFHGDMLRALSTVYSVELLADNVEELNKNMRNVFLDHYRKQTGKDLNPKSELFKRMNEIIDANNIQGNSLELMKDDAQKLDEAFRDWSDVSFDNVSIDEQSAETKKVANNGERDTSKAKQPVAETKESDESKTLTTKEAQEQIDALIEKWIEKKSCTLERCSADIG